MASKDDHLAQATHNKTVADRLAAEGDFDWAITALFYSALHLVQAHFKDLGHDIRGHARRDRMMRQVPELAEGADSYRALRVFSENARYECLRFTEAEYEAVESGAYESIVDHLGDVANIDDSADREETEPT